jgi:hypothetical protein
MMIQNLEVRIVKSVNSKQLSVITVSAGVKFPTETYHFLEFLLKIFPPLQIA